jgi:hypothetical protein
MGFVNIFVNKFPSRYVLYNPWSSVFLQMFSISEFSCYFWLEPEYCGTTLVFRCFSYELLGEDGTFEVLAAVQLRIPLVWAVTGKRIIIRRTLRPLKMRKIRGLETWVSHYPTKQRRIPEEKAAQTVTDLVKPYLYSHGQAMWVPGGRGSQISR